MVSRRRLHTIGMGVGKRMRGDACVAQGEGLKREQDDGRRKRPPPSSHAAPAPTGMKGTDTIPTFEGFTPAPTGLQGGGDHSI